MNVILFGASGMVGQGVLRECLLDPQVDEVLTIGRSSLNQAGPKLKEIIRPDLFDLSSLLDELTGYDACFFCLGVSSVGMKDQDYHRITYELTLSVARKLAAGNPQMTFIYVSGTGTDSTERGKVMWARVKGATENALLRLPFKAACMFRPGAIVPMHGIRSKTRFYNAIYLITAPLWPLLRRLFPNHISTTEVVGRAMLRVVKEGPPKPFMEPPDLEAFAG